MASGSLNKMGIDGLPFDVAGDADLSEMFTSFVNSVIVTSGVGSISQEKRVPEVSSVVLVLKPGDKSLLASIQDSGDAVSLSYTHRDGTRYAGLGTINIEANTTMQNRTTLTLLPVGVWTESLP